MTEIEANLTELKEQEKNLRSKYGNIDKRKGSAMLNKKLRGSSKKYFDSGDYNMERERAAPKLQKNRVSNLAIIPGKNRRLINMKTTTHSEGNATSVEVMGGSD